MGKVVNQEILEEKQNEKDKDLIITDLILELAEKDQRLNDLELIVADMLGGTA